MMERAFDDPDHKHYGPARRLMVMLLQLGIIGWDGVAADRWDDSKAIGMTWDQQLCRLLNAGIDEASAQRRVLHDLLNISR